MALAQPVSVVDDRCRAGFDAAVIAVDRLVPADRRGLEAVGLLLFDKHLNILAQGALVVLERENIVSPFVEDLARDGALAPHRVTGHDGAVDRQHVQQFRDRHDLVRLLRHLDLAKHQPSRRRKPYGWRLSCPFPDTSGAPSCRRSRSPRPARRSVTPPRRRNSAETSPHRAWRRYRRADHATVGKRPEPAQKVELLCPEAGDFHEALGPRQDRQQAQQHLIKPVDHLATLPGRDRK